MYQCTHVSTNSLRKCPFPYTFIYPVMLSNFDLCLIDKNGLSVVIICTSVIMNEVEPFSLFLKASFFPSFWYRSCLHIKEVKHLPYIAIFFSVYDYLWTCLWYIFVKSDLSAFTSFFFVCVCVCVPWLKRPSIFDCKNFFPVFTDTVL